MDFNSSLKGERGSDFSLLESIFVLFFFFSWDLLIGLKWLSLAVTVSMRRGSKQLSTRGRSEASNLPFSTYKIKDLL